jgi:predicted Zn-dependent peptidase
MRQKQKTIASIAAALLIILGTLWIKGETHFADSVSIKNRLGIKTSLINIKNNNVLYVRCRFKNAGVLHNPLDKHGISAVLGALMFRKINGLSPEKTKERMLELGLRHFLVHTFGDDFEISFHCLKDRVLEALRFLSPAFNRPEFSKNDLEFAKGMFPYMLEVDTCDPQELLLEKLLAMLYPNHQYGLSNTGSSQAICGITSEDIENFTKSHFSRSNLDVLLVGDLSKFGVRKCLDALFMIPPENSPPPVAVEIKQMLSKENIAVINKQNMEDVVGVMTGVRIDHLTDKEQAALHIVIATLYDHKTGDFVNGLRSCNIANDAYHSFLKRFLSNVFYFTVFIDKKDLENYLKYLEEKSLHYAQKIAFDDMETARNYFIAQFRNGFMNLTDIDKCRDMYSLPFSKVDRKVFVKIMKKLFDPSRTRTVIIGNNLKLPTEAPKRINR